MRTPHPHLACLIALSIVISAAAPPNKPTPVKDGIVGSDVMGDRGRSGPDGWAWAPVTRNQAPGGTAPGQTPARVRNTPNAQPESNGGKNLPRGEDPGTPVSARSTGPGTLDRPAKTP